MKHVYPAYRLDILFKALEEKSKELRKMAKQIRSQFPMEKEPETRDETFIELDNEIKELHSEFVDEQYNVIGEYNSLFKTYYVTVDELQVMFDLDKLYIERHIIPHVRTLYLSKIIRRYIKREHTLLRESMLDKVINLNDIDYEKKIFINKNDLEKWFFSHMISDDILITEDVVKYCLQDRKKAAMHSTKTIKKIHDLKYNMQLQRLELDRIYIKANVETINPLSRIPSNRLISFVNGSSLV